MSDQENSAGSWWGDMADAFKESVKSLISSGTERLNKEIVGQGDVSDYPRQQLENDYYDDEQTRQHAADQKPHREQAGRWCRVLSGTHLRCGVEVVERDVFHASRSATLVLLGGIVVDRHAFVFL